MHLKWSRQVINPKNDDSALFKKENAKSLKRGIIFVDFFFFFFCRWRFSFFFLGTFISEIWAYYLFDGYWALIKNRDMRGKGSVNYQCNCQSAIGKVRIALWQSGGQSTWHLQHLPYDPSTNSCTKVIDFQRLQPIQPARVAWFVKPSLSHAVDCALSANSGSSPA